jgi:nucleoside-diphosphate-sugar epimerase
MIFMRVFIVGGTGFLGYYSTLEFLRRGHQVSTISLLDIPLREWFPKDVKVEYGDVFTTSESQLIMLFSGYDALVYAVGPDDRFIPKSPAYSFLHERLVEACGRVIAAARNANVKRCVVLNSYFAYFDRIWPQKSLANHHPYIKCRIEQAERVINEGGNSMAVMMLELPYIFGVMPERIPL